MKMIDNIKIAKKLPGIIVLLSLVTALLTGTMSYFAARSSLQDEAESKLAAVLSDRAAMASNWLQSIDEDLNTQALNPATLQAVRDFTSGWETISGNQTAYLQDYYINRNPNPTGSKENLDYATDGSAYSRTHAQFHPYFRQFLRDRGYYDVFLFDPKGNLVYSVFKENDYATNVVSGQWAGTDLGKAFTAARNAAATGESVFFDFKPYAPSNNAPASFIAKAIKDAQGRFAGVLAFQMPIDRMNAIMAHNAGLGKTGETYIVGQDALMRSDSRFSDASTILQRKVDTEPVKAAFAGKSDVVVTNDYRGQKVVSAFTTIDFGGTKWAIIAEQDAGEVFAASNGLRNQIFLQILVYIFVISVLGYYAARTIVRPINRLNATMTKLAKGDLSARIPFAKRGDEIGGMARTLATFKEELSTAEASNAENAGITSALNRSQAVIDFTPEGEIVNANENFLNTVGYSLEEIKGKHHRIFCEDKYTGSSEYREFWAKLGRGEYDAGIYKRIGNGGEEIWLRASYNPIFDKDNNVVRVSKFATCITETVLKEQINAGITSALNRSQAVIDFTPEGEILNANENFLNTLGYSLEQIKGKHHRMFCESKYVASNEYSNFWAKLGRGEYDSGVYKRIGANGKEIWIRASYNPIVNEEGKVIRVSKFAADITETVEKEHINAGITTALNRSQAVIDFTPEGKILSANESFLNTVGYQESEIVGQHHSMFAEPAYASSPEYRNFWAKLGRGEFDSGIYKRIGKGGKEIWLQASYNPILDDEGNVIRVTKFASDVTEQTVKDALNAGIIEALNRSQAVIEFEPDGTIVKANENFLQTVGYSESEIVGQHHRMFCDKAYTASSDYAAFWEKLRSGQFNSGTYQRFGKGGDEVWLQAAYNPIFDANGKVSKVAKFASDITQSVRDREAADAERKERAEEQALVVNSLADGLKQLSDGNLTATIDMKFAGDYEKTAY